jgi:hypothetical protein
LKPLLIAEYLNEEGEYKKHLGSHPTILMSWKEIKEPSFQAVKKKICK